MEGLKLMKKNKILLGMVTVLSVATLAACTGGDQDLVTMKGGKITVDEFFNDIKELDSTKQELVNAIIYKVAMDGYGKDVSNEDVEAEYKTLEDQYGSQLSELLAQQGFTEKTYKEQIKKYLAYKAMMESHVEITDEALKEAWETFHPEVTASIIYADSEEKIKELEGKLKDGEDFVKLAQENPVAFAEDNTGEIKFDSESQYIPEEVRDAAFKLKDGEQTEVIKSEEQTMYGPVEGFYIVKMIKNQDKGTDMNKYKKELEDIIKNEKLNDPAFTQKVLSDELNKADIKIKDDSLKDILVGYIIDDQDTEDQDKEDKDEDKKEEKEDDKDKEDKEEDKKESADDDKDKADESKAEDKDTTESSEDGASE